MKSQRKKQKSDCEIENSQLLSAMEEYNQYIAEQLKKIEDFDIWYEENYGRDFPKCWYSLIRTRAS